MIAVVGWWLAAVLAVIAWRLLDAALVDEANRAQGQVGTWLVGFAALASVTGWGAAIGALLRDRGRVRAGVVLLICVPLISAIFGWVAVSSTVVHPNDPLAAIWLVIIGLLLAIATLLIMLPEHLGI